MAMAILQGVKAYAAEDSANIDNLKALHAKSGGNSSLILQAMIESRCAEKKKEGGESRLQPYNHAKGGAELREEMQQFKDDPAFQALYKSILG